MEPIDFLRLTEELAAHRSSRRTNQTSALRSLSTLPITETELKLIAAAIAGLCKRPNGARLAQEWHE
jgi:hypothetical protein